MFHEKNANSENYPGVTVDVNVADIVKYLCIASVLIIAIIFSSKCIGTFFRLPKHSEE